MKTIHKAKAKKYATESTSSTLRFASTAVANIGVCNTGLPIDEEAAKPGKQGSLDLGLTAWIMLASNRNAWVRWIV